MSESNKCKVCDGDTPVPFRFCWKCRDTRATDCKLFEKSDRGTLTAGELPVGAVFTHGVLLAAEVLEAPTEAFGLVRISSDVAGFDFLLASAAVMLLRLPNSEPAPAKPEFAAPPDSELPTYDEIVGALGSNWEVMTEDWRCVITQDAPVLDRVRYYPGVWLGTRGKDLPYLNLQRDDGQRVRFEVPVDLLKSDVLQFLQNVREDYRAEFPNSNYDRHVRWLPMAESEAKQVHEAIDYMYQYSLTESERQQLKEDIVPVGGSGGTYPWSECVLTMDGSEFAWTPTPADMVREAMERQLKKSSDAMARDILRPTDAELFGMVFPRPKSVGRFPDVVPSDTTQRWRNVPADQVPRLERLLAEQVASGGTDCAASRSLLVRRERLIAEERERAEHLEERRIAYYDAGAGTEQLGDNVGIAALNLEKPLIAYKRRGR